MTFENQSKEFPAGAVITGDYARNIYVQPRSREGLF